VRHRAGRRRTHPLGRSHRARRHRRRREAPGHLSPAPRGAAARPARADPLRPRPRRCRPESRRQGRRRARRSARRDRRRTPRRRVPTRRITNHRRCPRPHPADRRAHGHRALASAPQRPGQRRERRARRPWRRVVRSSLPVRAVPRRPGGAGAGAPARAGRREAGRRREGIAPRLARPESRALRGGPRDPRSDRRRSAQHLRPSHRDHPGPAPARGHAGDPLRPRRDDGRRRGPGRSTDGLERRSPAVGGCT
jgi:hypothetical protein